MVLHATMMVFGKGQLYILCCYGSWMYALPDTAKGKAIGIVPWVKTLWAVIGLNLVSKPSWWWQELGG